MFNRIYNYMQERLAVAYFHSATAAEHEAEQQAWKAAFVAAVAEKEAELDAEYKALDEREDYLRYCESQLDSFNAWIEQQDVKLRRSHDSLTRRTDALDAREKKLDEREKQLNEREQKSENPPTILAPTGRQAVKGYVKAAKTLTRRGKEEKAVFDYDDEYDAEYDIYDAEYEAYYGDEYGDPPPRKRGKKHVSNN